MKRTISAIATVALLACQRHVQSDKHNRSTDSIVTNKGALPKKTVRTPLVIGILGVRSWGLSTRDVAAVVTSSLRNVVAEYRGLVLESSKLELLDLEIMMSCTYQDIRCLNSIASYLQKHRETKERLDFVVCGTVMDNVEGIQISLSSFNLDKKTRVDWKKSVSNVDSEKVLTTIAAEGLRTLLPLSTVPQSSFRVA